MTPLPHRSRVLATPEKLSKQPDFSDQPSIGPISVTPTDAFLTQQKKDGLPFPYFGSFENAVVDFTSPVKCVKVYAADGFRFEPRAP